MKKRPAIVLASLAALTLASCNRQPTEPTVIEPAPGNGDEVAVDPNVGTEQPGEVIQNQPFIAPDGIPITNAGDAEVQLPGLIPSTDANLRVKAVGKGRQDPFSGRVIIVRPELPDPTVIDDTDFVVPDGTSASSQPFLAGTEGFSGSNPSGSVARSSTSPSNSGSGGGRSRTTTASSGAPSSGGSRPGNSAPIASSGRSGNSGGSPVASSGRSGNSSGTTGTASGGSDTISGGGTSVAAASDLPDLTPRPPIPDPTTARAVEVTGVVQIGSSFQAIVKAPDEPTSRYVSVGQRLSNGRVLVKRIESNGSEPVVILEEGGVEVVRAIGAPSAEGEEAAA